MEEFKLEHPIIFTIFPLLVSFVFMSIFIDSLWLYICARFFYCVLTENKFN